MYYVPAFHAAQAVFITLNRFAGSVHLSYCVVSYRSHELRNPLASILSSAGMLERYQHSMSQESKDRHIQRIINQCRHMIRMLDELLTLSRARAGVITLNRKATDLQKFCVTLPIRP